MMFQSQQNLPYRNKSSSEGKRTVVAGGYKAGKKLDMGIQQLRLEEDRLLKLKQQQKQRDRALTNSRGSVRGGKRKTPAANPRKAQPLRLE